MLSTRALHSSPPTWQGALSNFEVPLGLSSPRRVAHDFFAQMQQRQSWRKRPDQFLIRGAILRTRTQFSFARGVQIPPERRAPQGSLYAAARSETRRLRLVLDKSVEHGGANAHELEQRALLGITGGGDQSSPHALILRDPIVIDQMREEFKIESQRKQRGCSEHNNLSLTLPAWNAISPIL
ncbi:hypothetical protein Tco_0727580 [Tanacetum coccineum]|uniref:Uncharacterized protein n=1 Tax=Tanacetum coccineum TaxID=301880 RepID=A0ABQ4YIQ7_9ASTR